VLNRETLCNLCISSAENNLILFRKLLSIQISNNNNGKVLYIILQTSFIPALACSRLASLICRSMSASLSENWFSTSLLCSSRTKIVKIKFFKFLLKKVKRGHKSCQHFIVISIFCALIFYV
jgi:hypothetical protein